jgi:hypothetical protein
MMPPIFLRPTIIFEAVIAGHDPAIHVVPVAPM